MDIKVVKRVYSGRYAIGFVLNDGRQVLDADVLKFLSRGGVIHGLGVSGGKIVGADGVKLSELPVVEAVKESQKRTGVISGGDKAIAPTLTAYRDLHRVCTQLSTVLCGTDSATFPCMEALRNHLFSACSDLIGYVEGESQKQAKEKIGQFVLSTFSASQLFEAIGYTGKQRVTNVQGALKNLVDFTYAVRSLSQSLSRVLHKCDLSVESMDTVQSSVVTALCSITGSSFDFMFDTIASKNSPDALFRQLKKYLKG